jgi:hypothetical protein
MRVVNSELVLCRANLALDFALAVVMAGGLDCNGLVRSSRVLLSATCTLLAWRGPNRCCKLFSQCDEKIRWSALRINTRITAACLLSLGSFAREGQGRSAHQAGSTSTTFSSDKTRAMDTR